MNYLYFRYFFEDGKIHLVRARITGVTTAVEEKFTVCEDLSVSLHKLDKELIIHKNRFLDCSKCRQIKAKTSGKDPNLDPPDVA